MRTRPITSETTISVQSMTQTERFQGREFHRQGAKNVKSHKEIRKMTVFKVALHYGY